MGLCIYIFVTVRQILNIFNFCLFITYNYLVIRSLLKHLKIILLLNL